MVQCRLYMLLRRGEDLEVGIVVSYILLMAPVLDPRDLAGEMGAEVVEMVEAVPEGFSLIRIPMMELGRRIHLAMNLVRVPRLGAVNSNIPCLPQTAVLSDTPTKVATEMVVLVEEGQGGSGEARRHLEEERIHQITRQKRILSSLLVGRPLLLCVKYLLEGPEPS